MFKEQKVILRLIQLYKDMPYLWDKTHKDYNNKHVRQVGHRVLLEVYKMLKPEATVKSLNKKIQNLRTNYFKELKKVKESDGDKIYVPTLYYYKALSFIGPNSESCCLPRDTMETETMEDPNPCRCCLAQGSHKDLNSTYIWLDQKEIYAEMLQECFNIVLSASLVGSGICDVCVKSLRAARAFKQTVLLSEEELVKKSTSLSGKNNHEKPIVPVMLESKYDINDDSDDSLGDDDEKPIVPVILESKYDINYDGSDDDFLADDTDQEPQISKIELELPPEEVKKKKPTQKKSIKSVNKRPSRTAQEWEDRDVKHLVDKLSIGNNDLTIRKKKSEMGQLTKYSDKSILGYICGYCDATYPDPKDLRAHTVKDHKKERLNFKAKFDLKDYKVRVDVTDLTCTLCDEKIDNLTSLKEHLVRIHDKVIHDDIKDHIMQFRLKKGDIYSCAMCSATYETFKILKQHMNKHYCNYTCPTCDSSFVTKGSLDTHLKTHLEGSFKCDYCEKVFANKDKKQSHVNIKHMGVRKISNCPYCNESFKYYYQRNQHLITVHNSEALYRCKACNKSFILKALLMYHIKRIHLMERNCQCSECGKRFFTKEYLKRHMVKHTGEKNFVCDICNKAFARKSSIREHMRIHNNERRFKCDICSMAFVQKCSLKSHLLSNHGISLPASDITLVNVNHIHAVNQNSLRRNSIHSSIQ